MSAKETPMVPGRKASLPVVYGDTPSFLGCPLLASAGPKPPDAVVCGVPWEGTVTWGSFTGCELAPRTIRHAAARYGGFLPEYGIDLFDHLTLADAGDVAVTPNSPEATMEAVYRQAASIFRVGSAPVFLGGDHSFTPEMVRALGEAREGRIGVVHLDAHLDNSPCFGGDTLPRCGPLHRIAQLPQVDPRNIVHFGIRGPRNSPAQYRRAQELGCRIMTIRDIRRQGVDAALEEAIAVASRGTEHLFVTVCSDCVDAGFNPGGPADFNGLFPGELLHALFRLGEAGLSGLDYVEIYPMQDPTSLSSHLAAWGVIHALAGMASRRRGAGKD